MDREKPVIRVGLSGNIIITSYPEGASKQLQDMNSGIGELDNIRERESIQVNPYRASLNAAIMRNKDLHGQIIREAEMSNANLQNADLHGAEMNFADLREADLWGVNLETTDLTYANLESVKNLPITEEKARRRCAIV